MHFLADRLIRSPMNYTGGKYKILKDILPHFPEKIMTFVDLFAGGLNVGINVNANKIIVNDQLTYLIDLYRFFQQQSLATIQQNILARIAELSLSDANQEGYLQLRKEYNSLRNILDLFLLTCYSFNHQIRFNSKHEFNTPFGKERSCYNTSIEQNLCAFVNTLQKRDFRFFNEDFLNIDLSKLTCADYVYCDPPYLITTGSYNDGKRGFKDWTETEETLLLQLLSQLNERGIPFGLSNVFEHKGAKNELLIEWAKSYHVHYIDKKYANCSYHFKDRETKTVEVFVTNIETEDISCCQPMLF